MRKNSYQNNEKKQFLFLFLIKKFSKYFVNICTQIIAYLSKTLSKFSNCLLSFFIIYSLKLIFVSNQCFCPFMFIQYYLFGLCQSELPEFRKKISFNSIVKLDCVIISQAIEFCLSENLQNMYFSTYISFILPLTLRRFLELQCFLAKEECVEEVTKKNSKSYGVGIWRASGSFAAIIIESLSVQESFKQIVIIVFPTMNFLRHWFSKVIFLLKKIYFIGFPF